MSAIEILFITHFQFHALITYRKKIAFKTSTILSRGHQLISSIMKAYYMLYYCLDNDVMYLCQVML